MSDTDAEKEVPMNSMKEEYDPQEQDISTPDEKVESSHVVKSSPKKRGKKVAAKEKEESEDEEEPVTPKQAVLDAPLVIEGKRVRQKVERLTTVTPKVESPKVEEFVGRGKGTALGELGYANEFISSKRAADLKPLHKLLYLRDGAASQAVLMKRHIRQFNGWWFEKGSAEWDKRVAYLSRLTTADVKRHRFNIGLHKAAPNKEEEIAQIMDFLDKPEGISNEQRAKASGKKSTKRKSTADVKTPSKRAKKIKNTEDANSDDSTEEKNESGEENDDDESEKKAKTKTPKKAATKPAVKKTPKKSSPKKEKKSKDDDEKKSEDDDKEEEKEKSADSDSSGETKEKEPVDDKSPSEAAVVTMIKELLKTFDLAQISMKQMCQAVCDKFPGTDLVDRKAFLKEKIKEALAEAEY